MIFTYFSGSEGPKAMRVIRC